MYTFEQLKEDVRKEAEALRVHATKEELEKLDIYKMRPSSTTQCCYGLMTGECDSKRASELIMLCAPIYIKGHSQMYPIDTVDEFRTYHWSPIEFYILREEARNANLISYLRGETETLEL